MNLSPPQRLVFAAISTTGMHVGTHEPWEIALVERRGDRSEHEHLFYVRPKLQNADPRALRLSRFHERTIGFADCTTKPEPIDKPSAAPFVWASPLQVAGKVARATADAHLIGVHAAVTASMLEVFLRRNAQAPAWQGQVDTDALAFGWLLGRRAMRRDQLRAEGAVNTHAFSHTLPLRSLDLSGSIGVEPPRDDALDALARARWARDMYDAMVGVAA